MESKNTFKKRKQKSILEKGTAKSHIIQIQWVHLHN